MVNPYNTQKINKELRNKWKILTNLDKRKVRKIKKQKFPPLEHDKIKKGWKNSDQVKTEKRKNKNRRLKIIVAIILAISVFALGLSGYLLEDSFLVVMAMLMFMVLCTLGITSLDNDNNKK